jgi:hypothetical protein
MALTKTWMTAALALAALQAHAAPITLTFDGLAVGTELADHGGFTWTASAGWLGTGNPPSLVNDQKVDGFVHAAVSGANYVVNTQHVLTAKWNGPGTFDFIGAWWTALTQAPNAVPARTGMWLQFVGYQGGVQKFATTACNSISDCDHAISSEQATAFTLNWSGIDELKVSRGFRGFTENIDAYAWALDDFTFSPSATTQPPGSPQVPEPSGLALVGLGLLAAACARRQRR